MAKNRISFVLTTQLSFSAFSRLSHSLIILALVLFWDLSLFYPIWYIITKISLLHWRTRISPNFTVINNFSFLMLLNFSESRNQAFLTTDVSLSEMAPTRYWGIWCFCLTWSSMTFSISHAGTVLDGYWQHRTFSGVLFDCYYFQHYFSSLQTSIHNGDLLLFSFPTFCRSVVSNPS